MRFNPKLILNTLGLLNMINGLLMLTAVPVSLIYKEDIWVQLFLAGLIAIGLGGASYIATFRSDNKDIRKKDGYLIVTFGWLSMSFVGTLPYILTGAIPDFTNAFFETLSGYTTTGASILSDIESLPKGVLYWRSLTQWIGGMGIIVLAVAIMPLLGIGGMQLFVAEAPGISPDKLHPRIKETAKRLWGIYVGLTAIEAVLLFLGEMNWYESINHALTTMATGGFSTNNASLAEASSYTQYVVILFMALAGTNFTLTYFGLHLNFKKIFSNEEFKYYYGGMFLITAIIAITLIIQLDFATEEAFRISLFHVVSVVTTTGYAVADHTAWVPFLTVIFFILMFTGGSAGSTAGGVKIVRHVILLKNSFLELKRQLHPSAVIPVRLNGKGVTEDITYNVLAFIMLYIMIFATGSVLLSSMGVDFMTSIGSVATSLGNIGPGLGTTGPVDNFAHIPGVGKWLLALLMLVGRLELFTVILLFNPAFWSKGR